MTLTSRADALRRADCAEQALPVASAFVCAVHARDTPCPYPAERRSPPGSHCTECGQVCSPTLPAMQADTRFQLAIPDALALIGAVRDHDPARCAAGAVPQLIPQSTVAHSRSSRHSEAS